MNKQTQNGKESPHRRRLRLRRETLRTLDERSLLQVVGGTEEEEPRGVVLDNGCGC